MNIVNVFCIKNDFDRTRFMYVKAITVNSYSVYS